MARPTPTHGVAELAFFLACGSVPALAQGSIVPEVCCILNIKIVTGDGRVVESGRIVLRDGIIETVDNQGIAPPDARVFDGTGLTAFPGFVDSHIVAGITVPPLITEGPARNPGATASARMADSHRSGIRPDASPDELLNITEDIAAPRRQAGFALGAFSPPSAIMGGRIGVADFSGGRRRDVLIKNNAAMAGALRPAAAEGYPGSTMGAIAQLRQAVLDAGWYRRSWSAFREHPTKMKAPPVDPVLEAMLPVVDGAMKVAFEADSSDEILRTLQISDELLIKPMIAGGTGAWKCAAVLAERRIPVLVSLNFGAEPKFAKPPAEKGAASQPASAPASQPESAPASQPASKPAEPGLAWPLVDSIPARLQDDRIRKYHERIRNVIELVKAGVPVALTTRGLGSPGEIHGALVKLVEHGLDRGEILKMLTTTPAELYGVSDRVGVIAPGRPAYVTIAKGAPGEKDFSVRAVFIQSARFEFEEAGGSNSGPAEAQPRAGRRRPRTDAGFENDDSQNVEKAPAAELKTTRGEKGGVQ